MISCVAYFIFGVIFGMFCVLGYIYYERRREYMAGFQKYDSESGTKAVIGVEDDSSEASR